MMTLFGVFCHSGTDFLFGQDRLSPSWCPCHLSTLNLSAALKKKEPSCSSSENLFLRCQSVWHYPQHITLLTLTAVRTSSLARPLLTARYIKPPKLFDLTVKEPASLPLRGAGYDLFIAQCHTRVSIWHIQSSVHAVCHWGDKKNMGVIYD